LIDPVSLVEGFFENSEQRLIAKWLHLFAIFTAAVVYLTDLRTVGIRAWDFGFILTIERHFHFVKSNPMNGYYQVHQLPFNIQDA
jgi:hypothetical protein